MLGLFLVAAGCSSGSYDKIELMPSPTIYTDTPFDPFQKLTVEAFAEQGVLNYVTDRRPATANDAQPYYADERGYLTRAGVARIAATPPFESWEEVRAVTLGGEREFERDLSVVSVEETGVLPAGLTPFHINAPPEGEMEAVARAFVERLDRQMAVSGSDDVFIYVHGYNVNFEYPLLVAKEMQHFLGYRGAFITFSWPATPSRLAYFKDLETIDPTVRTLRVFIEFLRERTRVRRIHLIGYSAGSRIAFGAVNQLALQQDSVDTAPVLETLLLIGSDIDPVHFLQGVADGLLDVCNRIAVYMSREDSALDMSRRVLSQRRLGQIWAPEEVPPEIEARIADIPSLEFIDVSFSDGSAAGNGHWYFRSSPWVSSDLFLSLLTDRTPEQRGLTRASGGAIWRFPEDYPDRLRLVLSESDEPLAASFDAQASVGR